MMNNILRNSCKELLRKVGLAKRTIQNKAIPQEVIPCRDWAIKSLEGYVVDLERIERYLMMDLKDQVLDQTWYNELASINNELEVLDAYFIHPLYRSSEFDRIALQLIQCLHRAHDITKDKPFILSNGSFSIAPSENAPTIYWLPVTSQLSLLDYPLFSHEFGHQLFMSHKREMEDLIFEFQDKLSAYLQPAVSHDDDKYESYVEKAANIVETWREWIEELFCDAVGLTIGGKAYLFAFSHFIRLGGVKEFMVPEKYLAKRSHPVSLLRIRFLAERAYKMGLETEAVRLEEEWNEIAKTLDINEDYFGYYELSYKNDITTLLDEMLIEADPVPFGKVGDICNTGVSAKYHGLINEAWEQFLRDPENYFPLEEKINAEFLAEIN
jgi:hypothetical protein